MKKKSSGDCCKVDKQLTKDLHFLCRNILYVLIFAGCSFFVTTGCNENNQQQVVTNAAGKYTCPMHPEITRDKPGSCPICGMKLLKKESSNAKVNDIGLESLLKPTNESVISTIPITIISKKEVTTELHALGSITYDTRYANTISSRVSGRIEKLFIKYRYQHIHKGDPVLSIYSPELNTAQQNLVFLLKNDPSNLNLINAAKEKLSLLGMSRFQLNEIIRTQKIAYTIIIYSPYTGHVHEAGNMDEKNNDNRFTQNISGVTQGLPLKEGMYLEAEQPVISIFNTGHAWVLLNIYSSDQGLVKKGDGVTIMPETAPGKAFKASIDFIEPFYKEGRKTLTARVYFTNEQELPIGSQVKASIMSTIKNADWLPSDAALSLGLNKIVFLKTGGNFQVHKIITGVVNDKYIQVVSGLSAKDEVAANAQYLMDSESFIKINQ